MNLPMHIHNRFDFELIDSNTRRLKKRVVSYNTVLDQYYACMRNEYGTGGYLRYLDVGTGVGELSPTRTSMFQYLARTTYDSSTAYCDDNNINVRVIHATFSETEANGLLTEVGLDTDNNRLVTHSLITDAEGHPMSIEKTNTDILHVTATIYSTFNVEGLAPLQFARYVKYYDTLGGSLDYDSSAATSYPISQLVGASLLYQTLGIFSSAFLQPCYNSIPIACDGSTCADVYYYAGGSIQALSDGSVRYTTGQITSDAWNLADFPIYKSLFFRPHIWLSFPNHQVYEPKELTFTLTGDGVTTDFNLGLPELMEDLSRVSVTVDGVLLSSSEYIWSGRDYSFGQAWKSYDTKYLTKMPQLVYNSYGSGAASPMPCFPGRYQMNTRMFEATPWYYDFQQPYTASVISCKGAISVNSQQIHYKLEYSTDNESWLIADEGDYTVNSSTFSSTFEEVTARYWRLTYNHIQAPNRPSYFLAFGKPEPTISFQTAPADGAVIEIKAYCEYPIKNNKWTIDPCVLDIKLTRGTD